ncbi:hypothetical protein HV819_05380 [Anaerococcus sp. AGMB00486]|uniref:ABC transporter permease n=2 Tax=Anaerococcus TaxID=165779 RepID=A0ABX2N9R6_9FIRM|nr:MULTISPECIES: hypothetical protein [Anaerococcus]MDY3005638.1 hypothetical protein [Anaerococcus porci]MSS78305.1 hypothetical protein [Anaerococcus porci]NVF11418.1 hypothetical protein [Anaerococcus faecalis]
MSGFFREIDLLLKKSKKIMIFMGIYLILLILITFGAFNETPPIEVFIEQAFKDNGNFIDFNNFILPISFFVIHFVPVFGISEIFYKDHIEFGTYIMPKFKSKRQYFLGKILGASIFNVFIGLLFFSIILLYLSLQGKNDLYLMKGFVRVAIFYILENILFTNMIFMIALFTKYLFALSVFIINLLIAILSNVRFILGQGSLIMKQDFYGGEFDLKVNLLFILIYFIIIILLLYFLPKYYDYYGREE